jgi:hypothetical protein
MAVCFAALIYATPFTRSDVIHKAGLLSTAARDIIRWAFHVNALGTCLSDFDATTELSRMHQFMVNGNADPYWIGNTGHANRDWIAWECLRCYIATALRIAVELDLARSQAVDTRHGASLVCYHCFARGALALEPKRIHLGYRSI